MVNWTSIPKEYLDRELELVLNQRYLHRLCRFHLRHLGRALHLVSLGLQAVAVFQGVQERCHLLSSCDQKQVVEPLKRTIFKWQREFDDQHGNDGDDCKRSNQRR
jgi:hypothetical protein